MRNIRSLDCEPGVDIFRLLIALVFDVCTKVIGVFKYKNNYILSYLPQEFLSDLKFNNISI